MIVGLLSGAALLRLDLAVVVAGMMVMVAVMTRLTRVKLGGATGDVLGATQQSAELVGLLLLSATW